MMDIVVINSYMKLAGAILVQAKTDVEHYKNQAGRNTNSILYVSEREYKRTVSFLNSEYANYLDQTINEWKNLKDSLYTPKKLSLK